MSYRNKTYVIFDGDEDIWAYRFMRGWKANQNVDFDFFDAHDVRPLTASASEETVRQRLRERLANTKQAIVLIGEKTKNLYRFVRWEMETCLKLDIPIIAANLNELRKMDRERCPAVIREAYVVHVPFKLKALQYALDQFPDEYRKRPASESGPRQYSDDIYRRLGLL